MWNAFLKFLDGEIGEAVLWSVAIVGGCVIVYFVLRHIFGPKRLPLQQKRTRRRHLRWSLTLLAVLGLLSLWMQFVTLPFLDAYMTAGMLRSLLLNIAAGAVIYIFVQSIQRAMLKEETEIETRHKIRGFSTWLGVGTFLVATALIWAPFIGDVGVFLGIVGAGLALSMQETILCIVGWGILQIRKPYDIGDRIEIDGRIGDVIGISVFQTTMLEVGNWVDADQSTGRLLITPNSMVIRQAVYNYTKGFPFIWNEFSTIVTFESDWQAAKDIMLRHAEHEDRKFDEEVERRIKDMQAQYAIRYGQLDPIVYTTIADNGVRLTLRFLSPVRQRRAMLHALSENILHAMIEHPSIDFAYPTTRFFSNVEEGKPQLGGRPGGEK
jgi:small-conductance mechanosensitive channel